jgi:3D-(3,5/4)-trihydroxycyclohexane-1,2-dione acylhydrolase (decyclizing)
VWSSRRPLIVAGGGVIYSEATEALRRVVDATGIPVAETQAGKGSLRHGHPCALGAIGATGTDGANAVARHADVVIGVGTRWTDFTTASHTLFQNPGVRFVNVNVAAFDAFKLAGVPVVADARVALEQLMTGLSGYRVADEHKDEVAGYVRSWEAQVERFYRSGNEPLPSQAEVIGAVNTAAEPRDVVVCAAGSMPGELHKLWRAGDPKSYHVEYGYSCMGYEIAGGIGVKLADPSREVFVLIGDGSYLMLGQELVTAVAEHIKLIVVLVDNHGHASIGSLSRAVGCGGFGTQYRYRSVSGGLDGDKLPVDLAANAASLGAQVFRAKTVPELTDALKAAREGDTTSVIHIETDPNVLVPSYGSWWDVPVAQVSASEDVARARSSYEQHLPEKRPYL